MEEAEGAAVMIGLALAVVALVLAFALRPVVASWRKAEVEVQVYEAGLLIDAGRVMRRLEPGRYSTWLTRRRIERYDLREQSMTVAGQEMLSADRMSVRASLIVRFAIASAEVFRSTALQPSMRVYEAAQIALRARVAARTLEQLLEDRGGLTEGLLAELEPVAASVGLKASAVELRDLTPSGPARQVWADVWRAQREGQAALERARGEQAALRSLANAARMLKGNPELMNLRLLQALGGAPGKPAPTVVLGSTAGLLPVSSGAAADAGEAPPKS
jgi:regulator of protease activity HflC (stomatin/prohibitin superfamily)